MLKVITFGVFDLLHIGHINLFYNSKRLGDYLIVAVQDDFNSVSNKPGLKLHDPLKTRMEKVDRVECVAKVIPYSQIDETIKTIGFDILVVGPDQKNDHFQKAFKWCKENKKTVITIERTEGISSSLLRSKSNFARN